MATFNFNIVNAKNSLLASIEMLMEMMVRSIDDDDVRRLLETRMSEIAGIITNKVFDYLLNGNVIDYDNAISVLVRLALGANAEFNSDLAIDASVADVNVESNGVRVTLSANGRVINLVLVPKTLPVQEIDRYYELMTRIFAEVDYIALPTVIESAKKLLERVSEEKRSVVEELVECREELKSIIDSV